MLERLEAPIRSEQGFSVPPDVAPQHPQESDQSKDTYLLATLSLPAVLWSAVSLIKDYLAGKAMDSAWKKITGRKTPRDELIEGKFKGSESFSAGVQSIKEGWQEMTPQTALIEALEIVYDSYGKEGQPVSAQITAEDIDRLRALYEFAPDQILNIAYEVHQTHGRGGEQVWNMMISAIANASGPAVVAQEVPKEEHKEITDTQRIIDRKLAERERIRREVVKDLFGKIVNNARGASLPESGAASVAIGEDKIMLSDGQRTLNTICEVIGRIETDQPLGDEFNRFIDGFGTENPIIGKILSVALKKVDESIEARRRAVDLLKLSKLDSPTGRGLAKALDAIAASDGDSVALLIVEGENGQRLMPRQIVVWSKNASYQLAVHQESSYYVEPNSFHAGMAYHVKGDRLEAGNAVMMIDAKNHYFFIAPEDMAHFRSLADTVTGDPKTKNSAIGRAFLKFFNDIQTIQKMVDPEYQLEARTPREVGKVANQLRRINRFSSLLQELNRVMEGHYNISGRILGYQINPWNGNKESVDANVVTRLAEVSKRYGADFKKPSDRFAFESAVSDLRKAILKWETPKVDDALLRIKRIFLKQAGTLSDRELQLTRSTDIGREGRIWRRISPQRLEAYSKGDGSKEQMPQELRQIVNFRVNDPDTLPTLQKVSELAEQRSWEVVIRESEKLLRMTDDLNAADRFMALAQLARASYEAREALRTWRTLERFEIMMLAGRMPPPKAVAILAELASKLKSDPLLRFDIPAGIRDIVQNVSVQDEAVWNANQLKNRWDRVGKRMKNYPHDVAAKIRTLAADWVQGDLKGYAPEFLLRVAMCNDMDELRGFISASRTGLVIPGTIDDEVRTLEPFFEKVAPLKEPVLGYRKLSKTQKAGLKDVITAWSTKGFDRRFLRYVALLPEAEWQAWNDPRSGNDADYLSMLETFRGEVDHALNGGEPRPVEAERSSTPRPATAITEKLPMVETAALEPPPPPAVEDFNEPVQKAVLRGYKGMKNLTYDVGIPSLLGAATFMGTGAIMNRAFGEIFGETDNRLALLGEGYATLGAAMLAERPVQRGWGYLKGRLLDRPYIPASAPFSISNFTSGLGTSMFLYRGIHELASYTGAGDTTSEFIGLFGTGLVQGGSWAALQTASPALANDIVNAGLYERGIQEAVAYGSGLAPAALKIIRAVKVAGGAFAIADTATALADATINMNATPAENIALDECAAGVTGSFILPSFYRSLCMLYDAGGVSSIDLRAKQVQNSLDRSEADGRMVNSANELIKSFSWQMWKAANNSMHDIPAPSLTGLIATANNDTVSGFFQQWEAFENSFFEKPSDRHWLFRTNAVDGGRFNDASSVAFWLNTPLQRTLGEIEDFYGQQLTMVKIAGGKGEKIEDVLKLVKGYKDELDRLSVANMLPRPGGIYPWQLH